MRRQIYRKRGGRSPLLWLLPILALAGAGAYLATSPMFERNAPEIEMPNVAFWNLKTPLKITLRDDTGIRSYRVVLNDGANDFVVAQAEPAEGTRQVEVALHLPKAGWNRKTERAAIRVEVTDVSRWNLLQGNRSEKEKVVAIDTKRPSAYVLANSYKITQGGSALVVFGASDEHLGEVAVKTSFGKVFRAVPFYKEGFYAALIAWPVTQKRFRAWVEARDEAGNVTKAHVPLFVERYRYRRSKITLKNRFLNGKIADLASQFDETAGVSDPLERFRLINEKVRENNEALIHKLASKLSTRMIRGWKIRPFYPLKNAKKVADFGTHRFYYYKGRLVSESYHMGLDLASVKMAAIRASNPGRVVFAGYNGIYGNMPMIDHGMGLYTIYGHCSTVEVSEGDEVRRNEVIAKTGKTGLALGDHLHFGVLVQGVEVRPREWMDSHWIHDNIEAVFSDAIRMIRRKSR